MVPRLSKILSKNFSILKLANCLLLAAVAVILLYNARVTSQSESKQEPADGSHSRQKRDVLADENRTRQDGGALYTRWGRTVCPDDEETELVYSGIGAGQHYDQTGGGSNYLCLPLDPLWAAFNAKLDNQGNIYGCEYEFPNSFPLDSGPIENINDNNVPCAVCRVRSRSSALMLPARNECYPGWTLEYWGYLATGHFGHKGRSEYICLDGKPEADEAGYRNENGALMYPVEGRCGSLPCPPYVEGRELTCAVCTK